MHSEKQEGEPLLLDRALGAHGASSWSGGPMLEQRWRRYGDSSTGEDGEDSRVEVGSWSKRWSVVVGVKVSERWCGLLMEEAVVGPGVPGSNARYPV